MLWLDSTQTLLQAAHPGVHGIESIAQVFREIRIRPVSSDRILYVFRQLTVAASRYEDSFVQKFKYRHFLSIAALCGPEGGRVGAFDVGALNECRNGEFAH